MSPAQHARRLKGHIAGLRTMTRFVPATLAWAGGVAAVPASGRFEGSPAGTRSPAGNVTTPALGERRRLDP